MAKPTRGDHEHRQGGVWEWPGTASEHPAHFTTLSKKREKNSLPSWVQLEKNKKTKLHPKALIVIVALAHPDRSDRQSVSRGRLWLFVESMMFKLQAWWWVTCWLKWAFGHKLQWSTWCLMRRLPCTQSGGGDAAKPSWGQGWHRPVSSSSQGCSRTLTLSSHLRDQGLPFRLLVHVTDD